MGPGLSLQAQAGDEQIISIIRLYTAIIDVIINTVHTMRDACCDKNIIAGLFYCTGAKKRSKS